MLGVDEALEWSLADDGLTIKAPKNKPCEYAFVFKITRRTEVE
jgi:alpha-L-fucosidase